jgi:hypothetical protein
MLAASLDEASMMGKGGRSITWIAGGAALAALYAAVIRPWHRHWGASSAEAYRLLPGDDLVGEPRLATTHALTIQAPPPAVWPWLAQLGQGRGGFYTYTWLENLMGLDMRNADRVLAEYQDIAAGDLVPLTPGGFGLTVAMAEPERLLVLHGDTRNGRSDIVPIAGPRDFANVSWGFYLFPEGKGATRLVERWRADYNPTLWNRVFYPWIMEPGAFLLQRGMLLGIKQRAEAH